MDYEDSFAKVLREKRLCAGMTQEDLAESAGVSTRYISRLECGDQHPNYRYLVALSSALKLRPSELMCAVEEEVGQYQTR